MNGIPTKSGLCVIHHVDVLNNGIFLDSGKYSVERNEAYWKTLQDQVISIVAQSITNRTHGVCEASQKYPSQSLICGEHVGSRVTNAGD